jgi:hypothetical protein
MDFEQWKTAAAAKLERIYEIDPARIPVKVWRQLYVQNHAPRDAADRVDVLHVNC